MKYYQRRLLKALPLFIALFVAGLYCRAQAPAKPAKVKSARAKSTLVKPAVANPATAAKPAAFVSAPAIIENFFNKYKAAGADSAVDYLFSTNKYFNNPTGVSQLKAKLDSARSSLGDYIGKELIVEKNASPSLVLYSYLVKHEVQPVRFIFIFYKPHNDWVFYRFLFDFEMDSELEDAAKISNKHP